MHWNTGVFFKKKVKFFVKLYGNVRDSGIMFILGKYKINNALMLYTILNSNPLDIAIGIICSKFGIPPIAIMLIVAFL